MRLAWELICDIAVAAEELSRCDEYIDAQGSCILRDARDLIRETVDNNVLRRMRESYAPAQECAGLYMDVPEIPETGAGVSGTDAKGLEPAAVHAVSRH